jgi:hypothetical protein
MYVGCVLISGGQIPYLKAYSTYIDGYDRRIALLNECMKQKAFQKFIEARVQQCFADVSLLLTVATLTGSETTRGEWRLDVHGSAHHADPAHSTCQASS